MRSDDFTPMGGTGKFVEVDETYIGRLRSVRSRVLPRPILFTGFTDRILFARIVKLSVGVRCFFREEQALVKPFGRATR
ncbi:hypothetical protein B5V01_30250 [Mesorhizobium erdmanii]|uniref:Uncharacterized protein n=2 Tax=Mesorhizobium TaxID=68287 RepID=A0A3M9X8V8_9HYPH|nr:hypothetical protein DNR46_17010 [Mesorhizobium japonicum]RXT36315.1 hypothetical protein B5V01_30250 [Mesorhizobium erdmanii]